MGAINKTVLIILFFALVNFAGKVKAEISANYLYNLSDFTGVIHLSSVRLNPDLFNKEIYVITGDLIRIFNSRGMEVYRFGENLDIGPFFDAAADNEGNIFVLSYKDHKIPTVTLCNYRGEYIREIKIQNLPQQFKDFKPNRMVYRHETLYLVSQSDLMLIMTDANGVFKEGLDLLPYLEIREEKRADNVISGFNIDHEGNMLFTAPITAKAYIIFPDRKWDAFGKRGSAPGKFGVPSGIVRDRSGYYYVSDVLRSVVMIFSKDFVFIKEFGYRGFGPDNLIGPREIALDEDSNLYVTQLRERGVSVFQIEGN